MFDKISSLAPPDHDDEEWRIRGNEEGNERIPCSTTAVKIWLIGVDRCISIPVWGRSKFSGTPGTISGTLCPSWAEGRLNKWPIMMKLTWREDRNYRMEAA